MKNNNLLFLINQSFKIYTGIDLPTPVEKEKSLAWLDKEATYSLLAHNTDVDPTFIYANHKALDTFGYNQKEILQLKSKFSASEIDREERLLLLQTVHKNGIAMNYTGPRITKDGRSFYIYHGIVWNVQNEENLNIAQAALFWLDTSVPQWFNIRKK